jgi:hypothetical protein
MLTEEQKIRAKEYRDKIHAAAEAGGHVFKKKGIGGGVTIKKLSKNGKEYYYQAWASLTEEQKKDRIAKSLEYARKNREQARLYRLEHPETKAAPTPEELQAKVTAFKKQQEELKALAVKQKEEEGEEEE